MSVPLVTQGPPARLTCGSPSPLTDTAVASLNPVRVRVLAVVRVLRGTSLWSVKLKASGVVSWARVVTVQVALLAPTVTVALCGVLKSAALVSCTASVWPLVRVPLVTQGPPLILNCGPPSPLTVTVTGTLRPVMLSVSEVRRVSRGTSL